MGRLKDKVVVVSGATGGIGKETSKLFCEEGATVFGVDIADTAGLQLEQSLKSSGHRFEYVHSNVCSTVDIEKLAETIKARVGGLDALVNNAGVILGKPFLQTSEDEWDTVQNVNLKSVFLMMKGLVPLMQGRKGSVINTSSIGGIVAFENLSAYGAAKAGVVMLSKGAAVDLAPNIRVNAVCPGVIDTPMPHSFLKDVPEKDAIMGAFADGALLGRLGNPKEIAMLYLYLASDESAFVTGSAISIDGGWSVR